MSSPHTFSTLSNPNMHSIFQEKKHVFVKRHEKHVCERHTSGLPHQPSSLAGLFDFASHNEEWCWPDFERQAGTERRQGIKAGKGLGYQTIYSLGSARCFAYCKEAERLTTAERACATCIRTLPGIIGTKGTPMLHLRCATC